MPAGSKRRISPNIAVIPHGVDTAIYQPLANRAEIRSEVFSRKWGEDRMVIINVNSNSRRKGILQTFEILVALQRRHNIPARLYMHMPAENKQEGTSLYEIAEQLGLKHKEDWTVGTEFFRNGMHGASMVSEVTLNRLYNAADCLITTTLGEGWGLSITEAAGAGLTAFVPDHTSCREIALQLSARGYDGVKLLPVSETGHVDMLDNSRIRYPVGVIGSAAKWRHGGRPERTMNAAALEPWTAPGIG